jgi:transglutaminase-like putative cysteine protease
MGAADGRATGFLNGIDASREGVVRVFERVRDIPFGFASHRDGDTLLSVGFGTCGPKHALLAQLYAQLGLETRFVYVGFRFDDTPGDWPPELRARVHDGVVRGHTALQLRRAGRWIDVDATFDRPLAAAGFLVNSGWDGQSSMPLTVTPLMRIESALSPADAEVVLGLHHRSGLPRSLVAKLNAWLEGVRAGTAPEPSRVAVGRRS